MPVAWNIFARDEGEGLFHHAVGARVAVHDGIAENLAAKGEQSEIDSPGIDADAGEIAAEVGTGAGQSGFDLLPLGQQVPLQAAEHFAVGIGEAMLLGEGQFARVEGGENGASAFCSKIKRQEIRRGHNWWFLVGWLLS